MESKKNLEGKLSDGCVSILRNLFRQRTIGGKHLPENIVLRWIRNLSKREHKMAIKDWKWCIKQGLIVSKPKPSGRHVSLNPRRLEEIIRLVK